MSTWYERNNIDKDAHNAKRRERYKNDPEVRRKYLEYKKAYNQKRGKELAELRKDQHKLTKSYFRMGEVVFMLGIGRSTLRLWEAKGHIPKPIDGPLKKQRVYTRRQIQLLRDYIDAVMGYRNNRMPKAAREQASAELFKLWNED